MMARWVMWVAFPAWVVVAAVGFYVTGNDVAGSRIRGVLFAVGCIIVVVLVKSRRQPDERVSVGSSRSDRFVALKESAYAVDASGAPDLRRYTDPLEYYIEMYERHLGAIEGKQGPGYEIELAHSRRVHATWGLIAKGNAAVPYALGLLRRPEPEAREDGASVLSALGRDDGVVDKLLEGLNSETDVTARDSLICALGRLKSRKAIPALAAIVRDENADGDTRWTAVESLGQIVRERFLKHDDPVRAALDWLDGRPDVIE